MACSGCREKGHTIKTCPKVKEEKVKIQRDRINMFIQIFPALIQNPVVIAMVWWQISKRVPLFDFFNKVLVGTEAFAVAVGGSIWDIERINMPEGIVMGAFLQETEDAVEFSSYVKKKILERSEQAHESAEQIPSQIYDHLIGDLLSWLGGGIDKVKDADFSDFGTPSGVGN